MAWNNRSNNGNGGRNGNYQNRWNNGGWNGNYPNQPQRWNNGGNYQNRSYNNNYGGYSGNYQQPQKPKYTKEQKLAFDTGMGYAVANKGKKINFSKPQNKASFDAGYKRGCEIVKKNPSKYPNR